MADSIRVAVPAAEERDAEQRREARREVTREIQEHGLAAAQASALADAPLRMSGPELACAHIVCQSALFLAGVWTRRLLGIEDSAKCRRWRPSALWSRPVLRSQRSIAQSLVEIVSTAPTLPSLDQVTSRVRNSSCAGASQ